MEQSKWETNWHLESKFIRCLMGNISKGHCLLGRAFSREKNEFMIFKALKIKIFLTHTLLLRTSAIFPLLSSDATPNTTSLLLTHPSPIRYMFRSFFEVHMRLKINLLVYLDGIHRLFCLFKSVYWVLSARHFRTLTNQGNCFYTPDMHCPDIGS